MIPMQTVKEVGIGVGSAIIAIAGTLLGPKGFKRLRAAHVGRRDRRAAKKTKSDKDPQ